MTKKLTPREYLIIGTSTLCFAASTGALLAAVYRSHKKLSANRILDQIKKAFLKEGPIDGSWIEMKKAPYQNYAIQSQVYYGGITRHEQEKIVQYEFIADANTGTVIDIYRV